MWLFGSAVVWRHLCGDIQLAFFDFSSPRRSDSVSNSPGFQLEVRMSDNTEALLVWREDEFEFEWGCYAQLASEAIFRART